LAGLFVAADDEQLRVPGPGDAEQRLGAQQPGAGAGTTDQVRPLNCSVRVVMVPLPFWLWPTAQTSLADRAVMANNHEQPQRTTSAGHAGPGQDQPLTASMQARGCFRWWWQVQGSNLGRLSRRFYSEPAGAARVAAYLRERLS